MLRVGCAQCTVRGGSTEEWDAKQEKVVVKMKAGKRVKVVDEMLILPEMFNRRVTGYSLPDG